MGFFDIFRARKAPQSADIAKERLQIIVAHQRAERSEKTVGIVSPEMLSKLQTEIMDVLKKYVKVDNDQVTVDIGNIDGHSVLELNVTLNDNANPA